jgi:hypothetical protein
VFGGVTEVIDVRDIFPVGTTLSVTPLCDDLAIKTTSDRWGRDLARCRLRRSR